MPLAPPVMIVVLDERFESREGFWAMVVILMLRLQDELGDIERTYQGEVVYIAA